MAQLVAVLGLPHAPALLRDAAAAATKGAPSPIARVREMLHRSKPDLVISIGNDRFRQLFLDNFPPFLVGRADRYDGIFAAEAVEFGLAHCSVAGDREAGTLMLRGLLRRDVDPAFSDELRLDHTIIVPLRLASWDLARPVVPLLVNSFAPPLLPATRFRDVGRMVADVIAEDMPAELRVALIASGELVAGADPSCVDSLAAGDIAATTSACGPRSPEAAGRAGPAFSPYLMALAAARGKPASYAGTLSQDGIVSAFAGWELDS